MTRITRLLIILTLVTLPLAAQMGSDLAQAQQVLSLADSAGAQQYAKSLYDDAAYRIRFAQENENSPKASLKEQARMRAREALFAARAALAKARWIGTNAAIRNLQADITRFGGRSELAIQDETSNINFGRGSTTKERIATAQAAIDLAKAAGAEKSVADNDLKTAQDTLNSANKVSSNGRNNSDVADHLAYVAEMTARRAYYAARFNESARFLPDVQLQRTRLAQTASEQSAAAERAQRQEAERRAAELQQQLAAQEANRQAQAAELERLRMQVDESRRAMARRIETDRAARIQATARLDEAMARYEAAVTAGSPDAESLRRQVEDASITLRTVQERERASEAAMSAEIESLRRDIQNAQGIDAAVLSQRQADLIRRQADLDQFRSEIRQDAERRAEIQRRHEAAVTSLLQQRRQADEQKEAMAAQIAAANQAAQQAAASAQSAQQQAETTQKQLLEQQKQLQESQAQAQAQLQQMQEAAAKQAADAEKARQEARAAQEELQRTRDEMTRRDAENRRKEMEAELARLAQTKRNDRGFVVTLPGIFFDTGKSQLKAGAKNTLTKIAAQLRNSENVRISVEGHTDDVGAEDKNMELSEKRAQAVRDVLVNAGVSADRITSSGKGEAEPIATNKTAAGRQQNRRVELVITQ